jgi:hypothetical protein
MVRVRELPPNPTLVGHIHLITLNFTQKVQGVSADLRISSTVIALIFKQLNIKIYTKYIKVV